MLLSLSESSLLSDEPSSDCDAEADDDNSIADASVIGKFLQP